MPPETSQAGPLPTKRGEIGFREDLHGRNATDADQDRGSSSPVPPLPARHPADRDHIESATTQATTPSPSSPTHDGSNPPALSSSTAHHDSSSTDSVRKHRFLNFFRKGKQPMAFAGLRYVTLVAFAVQTLAIIGTIVAWIVISRRYFGAGKNSAVTQMAGVSSAIFIHVVFAVGLLGQLIFLERRLFMLRAQRYSFKHPGQILPSSRYMGVSSEPAVGWAPWNRPPLPTYAAALAQSGVGTGDVEDHLIAQNPPPAYGNTRGSTLILQGFLRDSLRAQRPPSVRSVSSSRSLQSTRRRQDGDDHASSDGHLTVDMQHRNDQSRPVSYRSVDSTWETIQDANRALVLEETLTQLQRPPTALSRENPQPRA